MKKITNMAERITKVLFGNLLENLESLFTLDSGIWMPTTYRVLYGNA